MIGDGLAKLKDELSKEDSEKQKLGMDFPHEMSPAAFLQRALDIEAAQ